MVAQTDLNIDSILRGNWQDAAMFAKTPMAQEVLNNPDDLMSAIQHIPPEGKIILFEQIRKLWKRDGLFRTYMARAIAAQILDQQAFDRWADEQAALHAHGLSKTEEAEYLTEISF